MAYWTSKLGNKYDKSLIDRNEKETKCELDSLRRIKENRVCADCDSEPTVWASVNLGVFLCLRCGSIHRGIGTHISIPKGCTGTYLWGPDEIDRMRYHGNAKAKEVYGGDDFRPSPDASETTWRQFITNKYQHRKFSVERDSSAVEHTSLTTKVTKMDEKADLISFDDTDTNKEKTEVSRCNDSKKAGLKSNANKTTTSKSKYVKLTASKLKIPQEGFFSQFGL